MRQLAMAWLDQRTWRVIGLVSISVAGGMAWYGGGEVTETTSRLYLLIYWGVFLLFFLVALYMALLDLRYIRLQYLVGQRDLYQDTVGEEAFRRALKEAQEAERLANKGAKND
jgi:hypothetical protein